MVHGLLQHVLFCFGLVLLGRLVGGFGGSWSFFPILLDV